MEINSLGILGTLGGIIIVFTGINTLQSKTEFRLVFGGLELCIALFIFYLAAINFGVI